MNFNFENFRRQFLGAYNELTEFKKCQLHDQGVDIDNPPVKATLHDLEQEIHLINQVGNYLGGLLSILEDPNDPSSYFDGRVKFLVEESDRDD